MKNFIISFLSLVMGLTIGILIINNNKLDTTNRVVLLLILILGIALLIMILYRNYKFKFGK
ncbi:hypothetical protein ACE1MS_09505 [Lysinibacillus sp. fkY74-1]|uniref:hypothetical protein n=1 Tax=Lysinibacillus sphaericus TaxID=1421 RepID=UPI0018CD1246|nr:hypothetical protein [Lysinibacillus sphaericus]MBG9692579.1 hypothetical protein [Lysinibacillus sphaericus]MBG9754907.1 hypothetical protein [Lysinibacillus sphaericus]QTB15407.1 hypothetical protein J2B92_09570 [Lysinibacillus sphaericus]